jgi:hypothetical protein
MMFVIVVEGEFACMLRRSRTLGFGRLPRRGDIVSSLRGSVVWSMDGLASSQIPSQVLLQFVESEALAKIATRAAKLSEAAADNPCELGHPLWSKDQQRHDENQYEFQRTYSEHRTTI